MPSDPRWRVVVIDDSPDDRADVRRLLLRGSPRQYDFIEAAMGAAGVEAILAGPGGPPDCAILDYHLPDADAPELLRGLAGPEGALVCPVVVVTGSDGQAVGPAVLRAGAQDFIGKAWLTPESLTRAVENAVERWAMARELRASNAQLQLAMAAAKTGIWAWDLTTGAVSWTPECYALYGLPPEAVDETAAGFFRLVHPDDRARVEGTARAAIEAHGVYHCELRVAHPGAAVRWVQYQGSASYDRSGRPLQMLGTVTDISARKRAEGELAAALEQAQQAVRSRDDLVSLVSHDLRNPLSALVMGIAVLETEVGARGQKTLATMGRQANRMDEMILELLDVAQLHAAMPLALNRQDTDLVTLTRAVAEEHQQSAPRHRIEVRAAEDAIVGRWDAKRLRRVVNNLLSNAVKYSPGGGLVQVALETAREGGTTWARLRITDEGIGIAAADRARVFQWYSRGTNALKTAIQGTGIGLAGVRDIVVQHGGSIAVESEEGRGSTFTVRIPK